MDREQIARVAHEINRAYCAALGDASQAEWAQAPDWQKQSALAGVDMHLANPDSTPEQSHESWLAQKTAEGWTFGPVKDPAKKQHPCCVPYADLPTEQKAKDYLFRAVVHSLKALPAAPAAAPQIPAAGMVAVRYIGHRAEYIDGAYGTKTHFIKGESRLVPADKAKLMLQHPDVYQPGEATSAPAVAPVALKKPDESDEPTQIQRDAIAAMNSKAAVAQFIKVHFNQDFDPAKEKLADLKTKAIGLIDQYGIGE